MFKLCHKFVFLMLPRDLTNQNILNLTAVGVVQCGGRSMSPRTSSKCRIFSVSYLLDRVCFFLSVLESSVLRMG